MPEQYMSATHMTHVVEDVCTRSVVPCLTSGRLAVDVRQPAHASLLRFTKRNTLLCLSSWCIRIYLGCLGRTIGMRQW
jgi:hypothetical protein